MKTNGFITRKFGRLECDRKMLEMRLRCIDETIEELLNEAISLARLKRRCKRNLTKVNENLSKLAPRLKCEEIVAAKVLSLPGLEVSTEGQAETF